LVRVDTPPHVPRPLNRDHEDASRRLRVAPLANWDRARIKRAVPPTGYVGRLAPGSTLPCPRRFGERRRGRFAGRGASPSKDEQRRSGPSAVGREALATSGLHAVCQLAEAGAALAREAVNQRCRKRLPQRSQGPRRNLFGPGRRCSRAPIAPEEAAAAFDQGTRPALRPEENTPSRIAARFRNRRDWTPRLNACRRTLLLVLLAVMATVSFRARRGRRPATSSRPGVPLRGSPAGYNAPDRTNPLNLFGLPLRRVSYTPSESEAFGLPGAGVLQGAPQPDGSPARSASSPGSGRPPVKSSGLPAPERVAGRTPGSPGTSAPPPAREKKTNVSRART